MLKEPLYDSRTLKEWWQDQGLTYVTLDAPQPKKKVKHRLGCDIRLARTCLTFSADAIEDIGSTKLHMGIRRINGQYALLIRPAGNFDLRYIQVRPAAYGSNFSLINPGMVKQMLERGLRVGEYSLSKVKGGFVAVSQ